MRALTGIARRSVCAVFDDWQRAAVTDAFSLAGYSGPLVTAPVTSEDERYFLFDSEEFQNLRDVRTLERLLANMLRRKVGVIERTPMWGDPVPFK